MITKGGAEEMRDAINLAFAGSPGVDIVHFGNIEDNHYFLIPHKAPTVPSDYVSIYFLGAPGIVVNSGHVDEYPRIVY